MTKILNTAIVALAGAALISLAQPALAQMDDGKLGKVHFETSCKPDAQKLFDQAMLYQHSFWYRASQKVFEDVLKADPECGIAYWGIALSVLWNPHVAPPANNLPKGLLPSPRGRASVLRRSANVTISTRLRSCTPITKKSITASNFKKAFLLAFGDPYQKERATHTFKKTGPNSFSHGVRIRL